MAPHRYVGPKMPRNAIHQPARHFKKGIHGEYSAQALVRWNGYFGTRQAASQQSTH